MSCKIILIAKDFNEYEKFIGLDNYKEKVVIEYSDLKDNWIKNNLTKATETVYLLVHFKGTDSETSLCKEINLLKEKIKNEKIFIIPISESGESDSATVLHSKIIKNEKPENLDLESYKDYWEKRCRDFSKNDIMNSVLPFCIHCKNASMWKDFKTYFKERKEHIKDSLVIARKILMTGKPVWENSKFKDKLEKISNLVEPKNNDYELKELETKDFIEQMRKVGPEKKPGFIKLLEDLKEWVDRDNCSGSR